ncbi:hypothetical protein FRB99_009048 [Tulasnella sp. 403]|nr:hypothetical protein FRB99_009048 [Tulasnella sp. 403]
MATGDGEAEDPEDDSDLTDLLEDEGRLTPVEPSADVLVGSPVPSASPHEAMDVDEPPSTSAVGSPEMAGHNSDAEDPFYVQEI